MSCLHCPNRAAWPAARTIAEIIESNLHRPWQAHFKDRSPLPVRGPDRAAVAIDNRFGNGQAETGVAAVPTERGRALGEETIVDPMQMLLRDSRPFVTDSRDRYAVSC